MTYITTVSLKILSKQDGMPTRVLSNMKNRKAKPSFQIMSGNLKVKTNLMK